MERAAKIRQLVIFLFCGELLVHFHELGDAFGLGIEPALEAVGFHNSSVVGLMCLAKFWRHILYFIIRQLFNKYL